MVALFCRWILLLENMMLTTIVTGNNNYHLNVFRPRLGPTFHKVLFAGGLYFVVATVEGSSRSLKVGFLISDKK